MRWLLCCLATLPVVAVPALDAVGAAEGLSVLSGTLLGDPFRVWLGIGYALAWFSLWTLTPIATLAIALDTLLGGRRTRCAEARRRVSFTA